MALSRTIRIRRRPAAAAARASAPTGRLRARSSQPSLVLHRQRHLARPGPDRICRIHAGWRRSRAHRHRRRRCLRAQRVAHRSARPARNHDRLYRRREFLHAARGALHRLNLAARKPGTRAPSSSNSRWTPRRRSPPARFILPASSTALSWPTLRSAPGFRGKAAAPPKVAASPTCKSNSASRTTSPRNCAASDRTTAR